MFIHASPLPDAVLIPEALKLGPTSNDRMHSILDIAEPLLGVVRGAGDVAYARRFESNWVLVTRGLEDTYYFPYQPRHPRAGQPRYGWIDRPDGVRLGYLVPDARNDT